MSYNETYNALAGCYDDMTKDVNYPAWADFLEKLFLRCNHPIHTVLDLACGTGTMSLLLAERGYELIGVDFSPEMLAVAAEKSLQSSGIRPMFLCQAMDQLDLYGTIDACVCLLDSINHIIHPTELKRALQRVELFLEPGGLFAFDIHTPKHLKQLDGGVFLDETEDAYCIWRTDYSSRRQICTYAMDVFLQKNDGLWQREREIHEEYAYTPEELTQYLQEAGFIDIRQYGCLKLRRPSKGEDRIFFTARKSKQMR